MTVSSYPAYALTRLRSCSNTPTSASVVFELAQYAHVQFSTPTRQYAAPANHSARVAPRASTSSLARVVALARATDVPVAVAIARASPRPTIAAHAHARTTRDSRARRAARPGARARIASSRAARDSAARATVDRTRARAMATSHRDYHDAVRAALEDALALRSAPSKKMDGRNRAEVEYADAPSVLMPSVEIARGSAEDGACLIERAVNSARVSVRVRQCDELEEILARAFCKSLGRRADAFEVLRRAPVEGYDVSFLVLLEHVERMEAKGLVDFVVTFMEDVDKEISEQKLSVSSRGRTVAAAYLKQFV